MADAPGPAKKTGKTNQNGTSSLLAILIISSGDFTQLAAMGAAEREGRQTACRAVPLQP
jgi:hypothetical protein